MIRLGLRVFLDTNVLFSGFYSEGGPPGEILNLYVRGEITVVVSRQVLEELVVAIREKLPLAISALERLLTGVPPEVVADPPVAESDRARGVINAADAPILAAAMVARPDVFVTGNTRYFLDNPEVARVSGLRIMTPARFVDYLRVKMGD